MSGHSKWANIKHRKEKADAQKGAAFTKAAREIIVAVKQGGPDPEANFKLRMAIQSAKSANMPNDSITRAIKRAAGEGQNENYEEMVYEGYGPAGVAFIVEATTENRNRTASDVRYLFSKHGGNLGETGCVGWMFERKGVIEVPKASFAGSEDDLMMIALEAGAEDLVSGDEVYEITTAPEDTDAVRRQLDAAGVQYESVKLDRIPKNTVTLNLSQAVSVFKLVDALEDHDDVQQVFCNFDIPDDVMEQLEN